MGAYVAYKVETRTNMLIFKKRNFSVIRRFSDFLGLHDKLTEKYLRNGRIIPPAPEKSVIGRNIRFSLVYSRLFKKVIVNYVDRNYKD